MAESPQSFDQDAYPNSFQEPKYFTDGAGHVARAYTTDEFSSDTRVEVYNAKRRSWVEASSVETEIQFSGDWVPCTKDEGVGIAVESLDIDVEATIEANKDRLLGSIAAGNAEYNSGRRHKNLEELAADPDFWQSGQ